MIRHILLCVVLLALSLGVQLQEAVGPEVRVTLSNGREHTVELLSLREDVIVFSLQHGGNSDFLARSPFLIQIFPKDSIKKLVLPGSSNVLLGMGVGLGVGCLGGCLIGRSIETSNNTSDAQGCNETEGEIERAGNSTAGALIGGLVGTLAGAAIGSAASEKDIVLIDENNRDFPGLRGLARYKTEEPEFLKQRE